MCKQTKIAVLTCLITLLSSSITEAAQVCKPTSIRPTTPTSEFTDNKDGTISSNRTGLVWKKCSEGQTWNATNGKCSGTAAKYSWQTALQRVTDVNSKGGYAGKTDWRLPNIKDLASIVEEQCVNPAINLTVFPGSYSGWYWSSSPGDNVGATNAWYLDFSTGKDNWDYKILFQGRVRMVRSGL